MGQELNVPLIVTRMILAEKSDDTHNEVRAIDDELLILPHERVDELVIGELVQDSQCEKSGDERKVVQILGQVVNLAQWIDEAHKLKASGQILKHLPQLHVGLLLLLLPDQLLLLGKHLGLVEGLLTKGASFVPELLLLFLNQSPSGILPQLIQIVQHRVVQGLQAVRVVC